jgi:predicted ATPase
LKKELKFRPEDVAVYYFQPKDNGLTKVHRIRVGDRGDFLDRWPDGFFSERDAEIFPYV